MRMIWPSGVSCEACSRPTTARTPYSRAMTAPWVISPPISRTSLSMVTNSQLRGRDAAIGAMPFRWLRVHDKARSGPPVMGARILLAGSRYSFRCQSTVTWPTRSGLHQAVPRHPILSGLAVEPVGRHRYPGDLSNWIDSANFLLGQGEPHRTVGPSGEDGRAGGIAVLG